MSRLRVKRDIRLLRDTVEAARALGVDERLVFQAWWVAVERALLSFRAEMEPA